MRRLARRVLGGLLDAQTFDAQPPGLVHQSQIGHGPLPRPALGAIRFDEGPIRFAFAARSSKVRPQKHGRYVSHDRDQVFPLHAPQRKKAAASRTKHHRQTTYVEKKKRENRRTPDFRKLLGKLG